MPVMFTVTHRLERDLLEIVALTPGWSFGQELTSQRMVSAGMLMTMTDPERFVTTLRNTMIQELETYMGVR
jgi:hypothetical protein